MKRIFLIMVTVMAAISTISAQTSARIAEADSAYSRGEYAEAVQIYKTVGENGGWSSELLYDLGNAYARSGDYGNAMVNYLRALRIDPSNSQAKANVKYIESKVYDANRADLKGKKLSVDPDSPTFFSNVKSFIARDHRSDTWAIWGAACFILFVSCAAMYVFTRNVLVRKIGFFGGLVFLGMSVITIFFSFAAAGYKLNEGVVTAPKVKLKSEASTSAKENAASLNRGTRMEILDSVPVNSTKAQWYKVRMNSDFVGWLTADEFCVVGL